MRTVRIIGKALRTFTEQELLISGIKSLIVNYIKQQAKSGKLYIPEFMLFMLDQSIWNSLKREFGIITDLFLDDFHCKLNESRYASFKSVTTLQVCGSFSELSILKTIGSQIVSATICDYSGEFDPYKLNEFKSFKPKSVDLHTGQSVFFSGADLHFLSFAKHLGLYLYNPCSEILFDDMKRLGELDEFLLFSPISIDLDYIPLLLENEHLRIHIYTEASSDIGLLRVFFYRV
jgi:hypothetical protein